MENENMTIAEGAGIEGLPPPQSRLEKAFAAIATGDVSRCPEPQSRLEAYAYACALALSKGGGVSSWNDLTDKPFGVGVEKQDIVSNTDISITNGQSSVMDATLHELIVNSPVKLVDGEFYQISIDGVQYDCIGVYTNLGNMVPGVWLNPVGNHSVRLEISFMTSWYALFAPVSDGVHNIAISKPVETIKTLDEKYLPETVVLESELEAKGYQTEEQVMALINNALGAIENGT